MSTPAAAFARLPSVLDRMEIPYQVGGSVASSAHGVPRTTTCFPCREMNTAKQRSVAVRSGRMDGNRWSARSPQPRIQSCENSSDIVVAEKPRNDNGMASVG